MYTNSNNLNVHPSISILKHDHDSSLIDHSSTLPRLGQVPCTVARHWRLASTRRVKIDRVLGTAAACHCFSFSWDSGTFAQRSRLLPWSVCAGTAALGTVGECGAALCWGQKLGLATLLRCPSGPGPVREVAGFGSNRPARRRLTGCLGPRGRRRRG